MSVGGDKTSGKDPTPRPRGQNEHRRGQNEHRRGGGVPAVVVVQRSQRSYPAPEKLSGTSSTSMPRNSTLQSEDRSRMTRMTRMRISFIVSLRNHLNRYKN